MDQKHSRQPLSLIECRFHSFWLLGIYQRTQPDSKSNYSNEAFRCMLVTEVRTQIFHLSSLFLEKHSIQLLTAFPAGDGIIQLFKEPSVNLNKLLCMRKSQKSWELEIRSRTQMSSWCFLWAHKQIPIRTRAVEGATEGYNRHSIINTVINEPVKTKITILSFLQQQDYGKNSSQKENDTWKIQKPVGLISPKSALKINCFLSFFLSFLSNTVSNNF